MAMPSPKELKKLAKACRDAGIKRYKGEGFELEFTDEAPVKPRKSVQQRTESISPANTRFESDSIGEHELLLWSAGEDGNPFDPFAEKE